MSLDGVFLSEKDFLSIKNRIKNYAGIDLSSGKKTMVYNRLSKRIKVLNLNSFEEYLSLLNHDPDEVQFFINALSTNLTSFFREKHHFDILQNKILPELKDKKEINIWCSASSTGEEPYSIAFTCDRFMNLKNNRIKILASDINTDVLSKAQSGIYEYASVKKSFSEDEVKKWFLKGSGENEGYCKVLDYVKNQISFEKINLLEDFFFQKKFDVIFCRNALIYFDEEVQVKVFKKFKSVLNPNGYLIIGHSEIINKDLNIFKLIDKTCYQVT